MIQEGEENAEEAAEGAANAAAAVGGCEGVEEEEEETPDLTPDQKRVRPEALTARVTAVATAAASSSSAGGGGVLPMLLSPPAFTSTNEASHEDLRWLEAQGALKGLSGVHLATDEEISSLSLVGFNMRQYIVKIYKYIYIFPHQPVVFAATTLLCVRF